MAVEEPPKILKIKNIQKTEPIIFDAFHSRPVCNIPATGGKRANKILDRFRPAIVTDLDDYALTQTYAVMDRGPVKVRYIDTVGEYGLERDNPLPPLDVPITRHERGRGPLEELLEEEYARDVEALQKELQAKLISDIRKHKERDKKAILEARKNVNNMIGPDWYAELSPNQLIAVNKLAKAIFQDIKENSICATRNCLAELGLVPRPNPQQIKLALIESCRSPVEFILVLYQITNIGRTHYSVNDRLLLSALAHLTMRDTLKELHIRIPSPPPRPVPKKRKPKVKKKKKVSSPYLDTFMIKAPVWKPFVKPDKCYPHNEYFDYKKELEKHKIMLCTDEESLVELGEDGIDEEIIKGEADSKVEPVEEDLDPFTIIEQELVQEWILAQRLYNRLATTKCVPALHKASIYVPCLNKFYKYIDSSLSLSHKTRSHPHRAHSGLKPKEDKDILSSLRSKSQSRTSQRSMKSAENEPGKSKSNSKTKNLTGSALIPVPAFAEKCTVVNETEVEGEEVAPACDLTRYDGEGCVDCGCEYDQQCVEEWDKLIAKPSTPMCTVINQIGYEESVENIRLLEPKVAESASCVCKEMKLKKIEETCCQCDRCKADREQANKIVTHVIADTKVDDDDDATPLRIISAVQSKKICTCMEKYLARWRKWEARQGVKKAQEALKSLEEKFIITGVATGPDGRPIYILGGVKPKYRCICYKMDEIDAERERQIALLAQPLPSGCIRYIISGVRQTPEGNVYTITGAIPNPDYCCNDIYEAFAESHDTCMRLFEEYMKKIQYDTEEYMKELNPKYLEFQPATTEDMPLLGDPTGICICGEPPPPCDCPCCEEEKEEEEEMPCEESSLVCSCGGGSLYGHISNTTFACSCEDNVPVSDQSSRPLTMNRYDQSSDPRTIKGYNKSNRPRSMKDYDNSNRLSTMKYYDKSNYPRNMNDNDKSNYPPTTSSDDAGLARYIILEKFPKKVQHQMEILKRALNKMADDGFPLAKLPDVHILPHFSLWLAMRARKHWTSVERRRLYFISKKLWHFVDLCYNVPNMPKYEFLRGKLEKHNWNYHDFIKRQNTIDRQSFDYNMKAASINYLRDLYPSMYLYEFPSESFRNVIFSYLPSKMENITYFKLWKDYEYKEMTKSKR